MLHPPTLAADKIFVVLHSPLCNQPSWLARTRKRGNSLHSLAFLGQLSHTCSVSSPDSLSYRDWQGEQASGQVKHARYYWLLLAVAGRS